MPLRALLLLATLIARPAVAGPTDPAFAAMLRAVPAELPATAPLLAYARLDVGGGATPPALALSNMLPAPGLERGWPAAVGFNLAAVEAVLVVPGARPAETLRVLAGARGLTDAARVGEARTRRGFARDAAGAVPVFRRGANGAISITDREPEDPFGGGVGLSQRIALTPAGLVVTATDAAMARALGALRGGASLAGSAAGRAMLAGLGDATVVGALVLAPRVEPGDPARMLGAAPAAPLPGPPMPPWTFAALTEVAAPGGARRPRVVLATAEPEASRAALAARLPGAEVAVRPQRVESLAVVVADLPPEIGGATLRRWFEAMARREALPVEIGNGAR